MPSSCFALVRSTCSLLGALALAAAVPAAAQPVLNELVANHTGTDTHEYVEVFGDPSTDYSAYTVLELEGDGGSTPGVVDGAWSVGSTDGAGIWFTGFLANEIENGTITLLLVEGFTGLVGDDLDTDDDGVLDATPWTALADGVAITDGGSGDLTYASVVLDAGFDGGLFSPGGVSRIPDGADTDTAADWVRNDFDGEGLPGFIGTPEPGEAINTPGLPNEAVPAVLSDPVLNEVVANHTGSDTNEYVEVFGDPAGNYSAFTVLELEGDSGSTPGVVDGAWTVGTTDGNGLWFTGFLANEIENGTITLLLVENFTGGVGDDLDTDDDGVLDATPWDRLVDDVAISDGGSGDRTYSAVVLDAGFDGGVFSPGGVSRIPDGADTDSAADWLRNDFDGEGLPGFVGTPEPGEAFNTPGLPNEEVPAPAAAWVINEIHADPASDSACSGFGLPDGCGDANGDGSRNATQDEFVELVNATGSDQDVSGWTIADGFGVRHTFPAGTVIAADCGVLVFGGGSPSGLFGGMTVQTASSGALGLNNGGDTVTLADAGGGVVAEVTYGGEGGDDQSLTLDPDVDGTTYVLHSTASGADGTIFSPGTRVDGTAFDGCSVGGTAATICEIQGTGLASPFEGQLVTTTGNVVTALDSNGFFMQSPGACDGDPASSDGIFVFTDDPPAVVVGDVVDVTASVQEFFDLTELTAPAVTVTGVGAVPAPVLFDETTPSPDQPQPDTELERYEGMLVRFSGVTTGPADRFGDAPVVAKADPVFREPGIAFPGLPDLPVWDGNPEIFEIDPDGLLLPDVDLFRGQEIVECEGPLSFSFGDYVVLPTLLAVGPEPAMPVPVSDRADGEVTVATLNVLRLFDEIDDPDVDDAVEDPFVVEERLDRFSEYVRVVLGAPQVVAVQEVENLSILQRLADRIAADDPGVGYTAILEEGNDIGGIDVGFLVLDGVVVQEVRQIGKDLTFELDGTEHILYDRPPLLIRVRVPTGTGSGTFPLAIVNNHLRSLGGIEDPDPDEALRVRTKRFEQALTLREELTAETRLLVTGDFNAFQFTDGYVDVMGQVTGEADPLGALFPVVPVHPVFENRIDLLPAEERYTFVFDGSAQVLDHMVVSPGLRPFVSGLEIGRGNVDSPDRFENDPRPDNPVLSVSDHDGVVIYLEAGK